MIELCKEGNKVALTYDGCHQVKLTLNVDNQNNFVFVEVWESKEHIAKYARSRLADGTVELMRTLCEQGPAMRVFDITEA